MNIPLDLQYRHAGVVFHFFKVRRDKDASRLRSPHNENDQTKVRIAIILSTILHSRPGPVENCTLVSIDEGRNDSRNNAASYIKVNE